MFKVSPIGIYIHRKYVNFVDETRILIILLLSIAVVIKNYLSKIRISLAVIMELTEWKLHWNMLISDEMNVTYIESAKLISG